MWLFGEKHKCRREPTARSSLPDQLPLGDMRAGKGIDPTSAVGAGPAGVHWNHGRPGVAFGRPPGGRWRFTWTPFHVRALTFHRAFRSIYPSNSSPTESRDTEKYQTSFINLHSSFFCVPLP
jgi:hypothetical protein